MGCILRDDWVLMRAASSGQQWQAKAAPSFFFCGGFALTLCSLCCARMRISYAYLYIVPYVCDCIVSCSMRSVFDCYLVVRNWSVTLTCKRAIVLDR